MQRADRLDRLSLGSGAMRWVAIGRLTRRIVTLSCVAVVFAGLMIAGCGSGSVRLTSKRTTVTVPGSPVPASAIPRLRAIADRAAKENGGAVPSWISAVVTTQEEALTSATPGAVVPAGGKTVVYLVTMKGHFKFERGPRLLSGPRTHALTLNYQSLVVIAKTFEVTAGGLGPKPPPVAPSSLGPVSWLKR